MKDRDARRLLDELRAEFNKLESRVLTLGDQVRMLQIREQSREAMAAQEKADNGPQISVPDTSGRPFPKREAV